MVNHFPYLGLFVLLILGGIGFPFPEGGSRSSILHYCFAISS